MAMTSVSCLDATTERQMTNNPIGMIQDQVILEGLGQSVEIQVPKCSFYHSAETGKLSFVTI